MAPHSSTLAWKIPWTEEPGRLQSIGSLWVGHDWATSLSLFSFTHWRRKWQPTPVFLPWKSQGGGAWWAAVYGVARGRTRLKWLSSSLHLSIIYLPHSQHVQNLNHYHPSSTLFYTSVLWHHHVLNFPNLVHLWSNTLLMPLDFMGHQFLKTESLYFMSISQISLLFFPLSLL